MGRIELKAIHYLQLKQNQGQYDPSLYIMLGQHVAICPTPFKNIGA